MAMKVQKKIQKLVALAVVYASLPLLLLLTDPQKLPLIALVLPVVLIFVICFVTVLLIVRLVRPSTGATKQRVIAFLSALLPTLIIVLQSIQQLSTKDVLIVLSLWLVFVWYMQKVDI